MHTPVPQFARGSFLNVSLALMLSSFVSVGLYFVRVVDTGNFRYWFLLWNLVLGWLPLLFAWKLKSSLKTSLWSRPKNLLLSVLWLLFLPNSFYILSDLIHLHDSGEVSLLYDIALFFSLIFNAYVAGFMSIFLVHMELIKRIDRRTAHRLVAFVLLLCGFAIYLGRYLRWNSWDVIFNPAGLLFDVSERVINPTAHPQFVATTLVYFLLLGTMYTVIWQFVNTLTRAKISK